MITIDCVSELLLEAISLAIDGHGIEGSLFLVRVVSYPSTPWKVMCTYMIGYVSIASRFPCVLDVHTHSMITLELLHTETRMYVTVLSYGTVTNGIQVRKCVTSSIVHEDGELGNTVCIPLQLAKTTHKVHLVGPTSPCLGCIH